MSIVIFLALINVFVHLLTAKYYADARATLERITREVEEFDRNNLPVQVDPNEWRG
jgi:hypothetical protein